MMAQHDSTQATIDEAVSWLSRFLRRGAPFIVIVAVAAGVTANLWSRTAAPWYRASATVLAMQSAPSYPELGLSAPDPVDPSVYAAVLLEGALPEHALRAVLGHPPSQAEQRSFMRHVNVSIRRRGTSSVLAINVTDTDPGFAVKTANALAEYLVLWDAQRGHTTLATSVRALQRSIVAINTELANGNQAGQPLTAQRRDALARLLRERTTQLAAAVAGLQSSATIPLVESLRPARTPVRAGPRVALDTALAVLLGSLIAILVLIGHERLDARARGRGDLAALTRLPVLAEFPLPSQAGAGEAANLIRSAMPRLGAQLETYVLGVTSPRSPLRHGSVALHLAASLARAGQRTLLVDANLRRAGITDRLPVTRATARPFEEHLANPRLDHTPAIVTVAERATCDFIPSFGGASRPAELLERSLDLLLDTWRQRYDVVVLDCPTVLSYADTLTIASACSGIVICTPQSLSTRDDVTRSLELLGRTSTKVLGLVLTNHRPPRRGSRSWGAQRSAGGRTQDPEAPLSAEREH
jgi:Mrp family chromosome partitioning ATPase